MTGVQTCALPIYQKSYKIGVNAAIFRNAPQSDPDNRIPIPFIRRGIKLVKGYFAKVGNITYADKSGWFEENLADIYDKNNEEIQTAAVFEDSITYGAAFELHWFDAEKGFQFHTLPIDQCIPIYDDSIKRELKEFIWYRKGEDTVDRATWYDETNYIDFEKSKDKWVKVKEGIHLYDRVPVLEANTDRDKKNFFDHVLPLTDMIDKIASMVGNEHEKFEESILLLRDYIDGVTKDENGLTEVDKVNKWRVLDKLGENVRDAAAYLERNVNDTFISNTLDRFERLMYEMLCIFNPNDESFATSSGIAQLYKLLGMELTVADMESYFGQFLQARIKLISNHKSGRVATPENADYVTINYRRNLPSDIAAISQIATILLGGKQVLSHESVLKLFPSTVVDDIEAELLKVKAEAPTVSNPLFGAEM